MDYRVHEILQARILEWVVFPFSRGSSPTQGSNPGLLHCRQILYQLSHKGSPRILEWVAYPLSSGSSQARNRTRVSCIAGRFFTNWAIREALSRHIKILIVHSINQLKFVPISFWLHTFFTIFLERRFFLTYSFSIETFPNTWTFAFVLCAWPWRCTCDSRSGSTLKHSCTSKTG